MTGFNTLRSLSPRTKALRPGQSITMRPSEAMGPWSGVFDNWRAREVSPYLYEAMREAVAPIDAAIERLTTLDGILRVEAESDRLQSQIDDWKEGVRVNDMQHGLQTFYASQSNELYEQGFCVGMYDLGQNDVERLRVADSKGVYFARKGKKLQAWYAPPGRSNSGRGDGTDQVERILRNTHRSARSLNTLLSDGGYKPLHLNRIVYAARNPEADNPYGVSLMRSMEFVTRILLTIQNSTSQAWERFGHPSLHVTYKTTNRAIGDATLQERKTELQDNLTAAMQSRAAGNVADFVNAVGKDDDITIGVIGAEGQVLEIEQPARHVLEQIVAKSGLASWVLGFHWSTAERLAQRQGEMMLTESRTRYELRRPGLVNLISTAMRARGVTWSPGDWQLVQELPSLQDILAKSQANFLDAQADMVRGNTVNGDNEEGGQASMSVDMDGKINIPLRPSPKAKAVRLKGDGGGEEWAEDGDALQALEDAGHAAIMQAWAALHTATAERLALEGEEVFLFDAAATDDLLALQDDFIAMAAREWGTNADEAGAVYRAWVLGVDTAAAEIGAEVIAGNARANYVGALQQRGLEMVRNTSVRAFRKDIIEDMQQGVYDGLSPRKVAHQLQQRFDIHGYDWLRLARSEITQAHADAKLAEYAEMEIEKYDYVTAGDSKVSSICRANAAGGPYERDKGPMPMRDSHPNCRCSIAAVVED